MGPLLAWLAGVAVTVLVLWLADRFYGEHDWVVRSTAPSAAVLALGAGFLLATPQGRDLGVALAAAGLWQQAAFFAALLYWALATWHNARFPLDRAYQLWLEEKQRSDASRTKADDWRRWLPRVLGLLVFGIALTHLWLAYRAGAHGWRTATLAGLVVVTASAYWLFVVARRRLGRRAKDLIEARSPKRAAMLERAFTPPGKHEPRLTAGHASATWTAYLSFLGVAALVTAFAWWDPLSVGNALGSMALGFVAFGGFLTGLVLLWGVAERLRWPLPVAVAALLLIATVVSLTRHYHPVRDCRDVEGCRTAVVRVAKPSVEEAALSWFAEARTQVPDGQPVPMIVVATAGGGIRAAYWTAVVMGSLPGAFGVDLATFERHLFAVSGVSGGSVGAAVRAALAPEIADAEALDAAVRQSLTRDFLAPVLASLAFVDLPSWVLPKIGQITRGEAFEQAFEDATGGRMARPFLDVGWRPGMPWRPLLLLNATHQETGRRVIAGHVRIDRDPFLDAFDLHHLLGIDVRLSTAAHNSARFSYVSPAGRLATYPADEGRGWVIDGGYFENFAALTALDLVRAALAAIAAEHGRDDLVRPVVIQISSDPGVGRTIQAPAGNPLERRDRARLGELRDCGAVAGTLPYDAVSDKQEGFLTGNQLLAPLRGVLGSRVAHGITASKELARFTCRRRAAQLPADYAHFAMCPIAAPPLGWVLSPGAMEQINGYRFGCANPGAYAAIREAFRALSPPAI